MRGRFRLYCEPTHLHSCQRKHVVELELPGLNRSCVQQGIIELGEEHRVL